MQKKHIFYANPLLGSILIILFSCILASGSVPDSFRVSYTVLLPKGSDTANKLRRTSDIRGIAISNILSKMFESCLLDIFGSWLYTDDNQFGFNKAWVAPMQFMLLIVLLALSFLAVIRSILLHQILPKPFLLLTGTRY